MSPEKFEKIRDGYARAITEVGFRLQHINLLLAKGPLIENPRLIPFDRLMDYESIAMGFRKIGELIVFANLIGHEEEYAALHPGYESEWNMGRLINRIKAINPEYYPIAIRRVEEKKIGDSGTKSVVVEDSTWLTEDELIVMNGQCADLIHGRNPFAPSIDYTQYNSLFKEWEQKIRTLLSEHSVILAGGKYMIVCLTNPQDGTVLQVALFKPTDDTE